MPFLGIQLLMVVLIVTFPELVSWGLDTHVTDVTPTEIVVPDLGGSSLLDSPGLDGLLTPPPAPETP